MNQYRSDLRQAVGELDGQYSELKAHARDQLGRLFDINDYPESLTGSFAINWGVINVDPPPYLQNLCPELYRQETRRVRRRFQQAIALIEHSFIAQLSDLVSTLTRRLTSTSNGTAMALRAVENMQRYFERFATHSVNSNQQLDELVADCQRLANRVEASLGDIGNSRVRLATELSQLDDRLHGMLVNRPPRRIIRSQDLH